MLSVFRQISRHSFAARTTIASDSVWWIAGLTAIVLDASSVPAKLFITRCIASPWWHSASPAYVLDHMTAYPLTAAWMIAHCFKRPPEAHNDTVAPVWLKLSLMAGAMGPSCALASLIAPMTPAQGQTLVYGLVMVVLCEVLMHQLTHLARSIKRKST